MSRRSATKLRPGLERLEEKRLPSALPSAAHGAKAVQSAIAQAADANPSATATPAAKYILNRITNPTPFNARLTPPFQQVLVQGKAPIPGQVYNILFISVRNSTAKTFDASNGLAVRVTGQSAAHAYPVLTGGQQWKPGQVIVFYLLTKKYYPIRPAVSAGFQFNFVRNHGTAIPGPSGIYLRVTYDPATFPRLLNWIVPFGPGAKGHELGLPDTSIWEFLPPTKHIIPL